MSWSNVSDYYHPKTFFAMAQQCSVHAGADATVHYLYTMNWIQSCFGAHVFDIPFNKRSELFDEGNALVSQQIEQMGLLKLLVPKPFTNAINITSIPLYHRNRIHWACAFFSFGPFKRSQWQLLPESYSPLARAETTFFMKFCFSKAIPLTGSIEKD